MQVEFQEEPTEISREEDNHPDYGADSEDPILLPAQDSNVPNSDSNPSSPRRDARKFYQIICPVSSKAVTNLGLSPLHLAIQNKHLDVVKGNQTSKIHSIIKYPLQTKYMIFLKVSVTLRFELCGGNKTQYGIPIKLLSSPFFPGIIFCKMPKMKYMRN